MLWTIISIFCVYLLRVNCFNVLIQLFAVKVNKRCIMNMNLGSPFQNLSTEILYGAPWRKNHHYVISGLQQNIIISETMHDRDEVTIEH